MTPVILSLVVLAVSPELDRAVEDALEVPGARVALGARRLPCAGPFTVGRIVRSGRIPVKAGACGRWGWVEVDVLVTAAVTTTEILAGAPLAGRVTGRTVRLTEPGLLTMDDVTASATAARRLARGTTLRAHLVRAGPPPGSRVTVRVQAGSLVVEQQGTVVACPGKQVCARLPGGGTVPGAMHDGALVVGGES